MNEDKERLLKICKVYGKKRKPRPPRDKKLKVDCLQSDTFVANLGEISYLASSTGVRQVLRKLAGEKDSYML